MTQDMPSEPDDSAEGEPHMHRTASNGTGATGTGLLGASTNRDDRRIIDGLADRGWGNLPPRLAKARQSDVAVDCGWGRLVFGQTFADPDALVEAMREERPGGRDVCLYARDPHVLISLAPQELFLDPSHTYRLQLHRYRPRRAPVRGVIVRSLRDRTDAAGMNRVYHACSMVPAPVETLWHNQRTTTFTYLVAQDAASGRIVGTVTGVDHVAAFDDPEGGTSLWSLAVDPACALPGVGETLVRTLLERYQALGRSWLDLSVLHDNSPAIALYEKLGFRRVPVYCVKRRNSINEALFTPASVEGLDDLNPYARIIADEALRRGIDVQVRDPDVGELVLTSGSRSVVTWESLSELTSGVAVARCDDKHATRRVLTDAGIEVPPGRLATGGAEDVALLDELGELVVKPVRGEQGAGITVGVRTPEQLERAVDDARRHCDRVLLERRCPGDDLRIVVIDHEVVAAAVRRPATVVGTGRHTIAQLVEAQSRRRAAATHGESTIPLDDATVSCIEEAGHTVDDVLPEGQVLEVRRTANLHTGGTIHDVTDELHPELAEVAVRASQAIGIPVTGLDLIVPDVSGPDYVMIEANERPGLANHEPRPTAERFVDLLFPATSSPVRSPQDDRTASERRAVVKR